MPPLTFYVTIRCGSLTFPSRSAIHCEDRSELENAVRQYVLEWRKEIGPDSPIYSKPVAADVVDSVRRFIMTSHM